MATSKNISSGIYYREIDLTIITQSVGTFAGAMLGLTEKGPAFQIMSSSTFGERATRLGDLNPLYSSSYYAREFLEQANNYKEVRILGLEGYNEIAIGSPNTGGYDKVFAIMYVVSGVLTRTPAGTGPFTNPTTAGIQSIGAILKPRRTAFTGFAEVDYVSIGTILQRDGITTAATDDLFELTVHYTDPSLNITIPCSLRPDVKEYVGKVFGTTPRDNTKVQGRTAPLWADFVYPSIQIKPDTATAAAYYYPGTIVSPQTFLDMKEGDITVQLGFVYASTTLTGLATGATTTATAAAFPSEIVSGSPIKFTGTSITVTNIPGVTSLDGTVFYADVITGASFDVYSDALLTIKVETSGAFSAGTVEQMFVPTWETEVMTMGGTSDTLAIPFQTPITPWFVSDADSNGDVQRLFRIWSISDGDNANTEIKIEISNINPDGNGEKGSFDLYVREFTDREDQQRKVVEAFTNLTLDPMSDNFISRRLGDGEIFPLQSRYIFSEMNETDELADNELPYGVEGYVNATGIVFPDVVWSNEYDFTKPLTKQMLGLCNNQTNMLSEMSAEYLSFKNVDVITSATGKGFHLNPNNNLNINTALFTVASQDIYQINPPTNTNPVSGLEKTKRSKYVVALAGGFDAFNLYKARDWATNTSKDFEALGLAIEVLGDNESLDADFSVLVTPDFNFEDHASATEAVLEMITTRGDALYLPDFRYSLDSIPDDAKISLNSSNMRSNFTAVYFPHVQIEDTINKTNIWLPPSIIALATIAATATNEQVWQPPAGSLRTITSNLVRTRKRMKLDDREVLKSANINPITLFPGSGFEITESRTTQEFFSALSFVHNRLLLGYAKKALNQTLRPILHQLNSGNLQNTFVNTIKPIFDRIKKLNGLEDFSVSAASSADDRTTLTGNITIVPLYPVEKIAISFILQNGSLSFNNQ